MALINLVSSVMVVLTLLLWSSTSNQTPLPPEVVGYPHYNKTAESQNKTISDLMQRQTDTVKKLVANHHQIEYPVITKYQPEDRKKLEIEDLKIRCQHLAKLLNKTTTSPPPTTRRPSLRPLHGFYITTEATPPTTPTTTSRPVQNIKYIKLEPVILQKTILSDGRVVYYWHKSLPSAVQFAPTSSTQASTSTTTTTTPASSYNFRNFFPSFYSSGGAEPTGEATTTKTTAEEMVYQQQMKFVVPVPYAPADDPGVRKPWELDQYAYYPKPLQPDTIAVQVPYVPTFHVIKALAVPNTAENIE